MINILCFGDSNTWGDPPVGGQVRFDRNTRWPGVLQNMLGTDYYVIEEGLGGRTTELDDEGSPVRNGLKYFPACVKSHRPLDWVVIMLGTNDLKDKYNRSAQQIAEGVGKLVDVAREGVEYTKGDDNEGRKLQICIASPAAVDPERSGRIGLDGAVEKLQQLAIELKNLAAKKDCAFVDVAPLAEVGEDGVHLTAAGHKSVADAVYNVVR